MRDPQEIKELEAQIALDKQKYNEIERLEGSYHDRKVSRRKGSARKFDSRCRGDASGSEKPAQLTSNKAERSPRMCCPEHFQRLSRIGGRELLFE